MVTATDPTIEDGRPVRPRPERARLPGHRDPVKEDLRGIGPRARGPRLILLARSQVGWRSLCRLMSRANMAGTKGAPRFRHALLDEHHEDVIVLSAGRSGEIGRRLLVGDRAGARAAAERLAARYGDGGFAIELATTCSPMMTGSSPNRWHWPRICDCRSWSPTPSTTPGRRIVSSTMS